MQITLAELLQYPAYQGCKVVAGETGTNKVVSYVSAFDAPDFYQYLRGNELLITTGYIYREDPSQLADLIRNLHELGACGLGIKLKRYIDELPEEVLELANQLHFPLVVIPREQYFINMSQGLISIVQEQAQILSTSEKVHSSFTRLMIEGGGIEQIINYLNELTEVQIAFYDTYFQEVVFSTGCSSEFEQIFQEKELEELLYTYLHYPVEINRKIYGYILLDAKEVNPTFLRYGFIGHAVTGLKLTMQKKISNYQIESRYRDEFVQDLVFNNIRSKEEVQRRAEIYGWRLDADFKVLIIHIDNLEEVYLRRGPEEVDDLKRKTYIRCYELLKSKYSQVLYTYFSDFIVYVVQQVNSSDLKSELRFIQERLINEAERKGTFKLSIGIGKVKSSFLNLHESFKEAWRALKLGRKIARNKQVVCYSELGAYTLLESVAATEEARNFYQTYLGELIRHDKNSNSELLVTLEGLVRNDWSLKETADDLFVHYNTMKYRMKRLSELLQVDLNDPEEKFNIELSLKLYQMAE